MTEITLAVRICGTGEDEDEVEKKRTPADDENPEQDGQSDGSLHASGLPATLMESHDTSGVDVRQDEHVQVQNRREHQSQAKKRDKTGDDRVVSVINDK